MNSSSIEVIALEGELDIARRAEINEALLVKGSESALLVDCSEVTYADSTALAELLRFRSAAAEKRVPVALLIGSTQFVRVIQYAGLNGVFQIFNDRASALTYLANEGKRA
ncbi:MAG: STAS domain-containing protein [Candidatus Eremiobacteraeota bacterium]|nr:STAS domain-containing protein [Candidatus Eremiobacteraeota bacterium]